MAKKTSSKLPKRKGEFTYRGQKIEDLQKMSIDEFAVLVPSRQRRKINRGFSEEHKKLLNKVRNKNENIRTHLRDMIVVPDMVGLKMGIHNGKEYVPVEIIAEMLGHYLGEYALTRGRVNHGAAGVGATKSSKFVPLK
ncbi:MAG: 30S ribosomal protein S19 [Candidatus Methanoperedens sp.]|jgi:small subunit ribosomal protein S19|nr:30S ribosomal protein S19 [Candidatus Methanoperedens sp.]PKL54418.1 MAG: 30S ribosomal protein S19 [Candidatus Methanoperedenaceae archaeon HGW-Methanoperedenaceae-1]